MIPDPKVLSFKATTVGVYLASLTFIFGSGPTSTGSSLANSQASPINQTSQLHLASAISDQQTQIVQIDSIPFETNVVALCCGAMASVDSAAVAIQNQPDSRLVIDGHSHSTELDGVALKRARNVFLYLMERGIDAERLVFRTFDDKCGATGRVDLYMVPPRQEIFAIRKECFIKPEAHCAQTIK